jgi:site-specific DNA-methyltransferase (adenine-specific)
MASPTAPAANLVTATIRNKDCFDAFADLADGSVDAVITDPPYFLDKLGDTWDVAGMKTSTQNAAVTSLPVGMKFDPAQGRAFQEFMGRVAEAALRVLKPGGAFIAFSAPRLYHRLGVAVEDAGYEVRDLWAWLYTQNQVKAMSVERFLDDSGLTPEEAELVRRELEVWKTPQIKSCIEPIVFAQKPKTDAAGRPITFVENWVANHVGLLNTAARVGEEMVPANIMTTGPISSALDRAFLVPKPSRFERGGTTHLSVKPLALMDQLIRLTVPAGGVVLDPFNGSGSTGISALRLGRSYEGFELDRKYFDQSKRRFVTAFGEEQLKWRQSGKVARTSIEATDATPAANAEVRGEGGLR